VNAVSPITIRPVERPAFDNTHMGDWKRWAQDNTGLLARYWHQQGQALGLGQDDNEDLDFWIRVQHDIELNARTRARLPHGGGAL
jgi:hypothetical protein